MAPDRQRHVMMSFSEPNDLSNPYVHLLVESLRASGEKVDFLDWRRLLLGPPQVFHIHWPETLLQRRSLAGRLAMRVFALILVLRSKVGLTAIVRTLHNSSPHEQPGWTDRHVLRLLDRATTEWILLSDAVDSHPGAAWSVIPHGELASWYARFGQSEERVASTDVLNFGLVREYKGVEDLVRVAEELPEVTFRVAGRVGDLELGRRLEVAAARLPNVSLDFRHIPDGTLAEYIRTAKLVVLPYRRFENSGAAMVALQMGIPVLIPSGSFADALRSDFPMLIRTFSSPLSNHHIREALNSSIAGTSKSQSTIDREWPQQARAHGLVYQRAASRLRFNAS